MLLKKIVKTHGKKIKTMMAGISGINTNIGDINANIGDMALSTDATDLTGAVNEMHDVLLYLLDFLEPYKPLIAPLSEPLVEGFVEGSYFQYGRLNGALIAFIKVSKTTAMSGETTIVWTYPDEYVPTEQQVLTAYGADGNEVSGIAVIIDTDGEIRVEGSVAANTVIFASYIEKI
jgi:hypothetical protein